MMVSVLYNGPAMVSTGSGVRVVALGNVEAVRIGDSRSKTQTKVNAKTSTTMGTVKVKAAKGFRFGGSKAARTEAAFA
jgi:hypothetical protein